MGFIIPQFLAGNAALETVGPSMMLIFTQKQLYNSLFSDFPLVDVVTKKTGLFPQRTARRFGDVQTISNSTTPHSTCHKISPHVFSAFPNPFPSHVWICMVYIDFSLNVFGFHVGKYMGVSKNSGTPKSSILIGFSIINHPFWGTPNFWKHLNISVPWMVWDMWYGTCGNPWWFGVPRMSLRLHHWD